MASAEFHQNAYKQPNERQVTSETVGEVTWSAIAGHELSQSPRDLYTAMFTGEDFLSFFGQIVRERHQYYQMPAEEFGDVGMWLWSMAGSEFLECFSGAYGLDLQVLEPALDSASREAAELEMAKVAQFYASPRISLSAEETERAKRQHLVPLETIAFRGIHAPLKDHHTLAGRMIDPDVWRLDDMDATDD